MKDNIRKALAYIFMAAGSLGIFTFVLTDILLLFSGLLFLPYVIPASLFLIFVSLLLFLIGYRFYDRKIAFVERILPEGLRRKEPAPEVPEAEAEPAYEEMLLKDLWTVIDRRTDMPGLDSYDTIPLYTCRNEAEAVCPASCYVMQIADEKKKRFFSECLVCGYSDFTLKDDREYRGGTDILKDVFSLPEDAGAGVTNSALVRLIRRYCMSDRNEESSEENDLQREINSGLAGARLMTKAGTESGKTTFSILNASFPDGKRWAALFTDHFALERYLNSRSDSVVLPSLLRDTYALTADDGKCEGIIINPGREEYKLTKKTLAGLFADQSVRKVTIDMKKDLYLIPVIFDGEDASTVLSEPDYELHYFPGAAKMFSEGSRINCTDLIPANFRNAGKARSEVMHARLLLNKQTGKQYVPLFLSYETLTSMINTIHVGVISFAEAKKLAEECAGVVIGPGVVNKIIPNTSEEKKPAPQASPAKNYASLMCGQLVALYRKTHDRSYSDEYVRRLTHIGFTEAEAKGLFMFEDMILKHDHIDILADPGYILNSYFSMKAPLLPESNDFYTDHQMFLCSEIVKIWDEAEWRYMRIKDNPDIPEEVLSEIFRISRYGGGELFIEYLTMMAEKSHTDIAKIQKYSQAEQNMIFKYKWNKGRNEPHPYGAE